MRGEKRPSGGEKREAESERSSDIFAIKEAKRKKEKKKGKKVLTKRERCDIIAKLSERDSELVFEN